MTWHLRKAQRTRCAPIFFFVFVLLPFWGGPTHFREGPCLPDGYLNTNYNKQRAIRLLQPLQPTLDALNAQIIAARNMQCANTKTRNAGHHQHRTPHSLLTSIFFRFHHPRPHAAV